MKPKKWIKKYCKKDYVICDGMTENMGIWESTLLPLALGGIILGISYVSMKTYQYIRRNR